MHTLSAFVDGVRLSLSLVAACLLMVLGAATGAAAAPSPDLPSPRDVSADFDGDGIADTATVVRGTRGWQIQVRLSRTARLRVLRLPSEVLTIVATDVDADGRIDLGASTRQHGIFAWINYGRGKFNGLPRRPLRAPAVHHLSASKRARLTGPKPDGDQQPTCRLHASLVTFFLDEPSGRVAARSQRSGPEHYLGASAPRAPPVL